MGLFSSFFLSYWAIVSNNRLSKQRCSCSIPINPINWRHQPLPHRYSVIVTPIWVMHFIIDADQRFVPATVRTVGHQKCYFLDYFVDILSRLSINWPYLAHFASDFKQSLSIHLAPLFATNKSSWMCQKMPIDRHNEISRKPSFRFTAALSAFVLLFLCQSAVANHKKKHPSGAYKYMHAH